MLLSSSNANSIVIGETFEQYATRILGAAGANYFSTLYNLGPDYEGKQDARAIVAYLAYDNAYAYGHIHMPHGAPEVGMWQRVAKLIANNGSRIMLNSPVSLVDRSIDMIDVNAGYTYTLTVNNTRKVRAKRVVFALPPQQLAYMGGTVVNQLATTPYIQYSQAIHACTWNAFFPSKWWKKYASTCNYGWCAETKAFNLSAYAREFYMGWNRQDNTPSPGSISFIQYVPTPERQQGNLLRYFFEDEMCEPLDTIFAASGQAGVQQELMQRTRLFLGAAIGTPIPDPTQSYYSSELYAYAGVAPGAPFTVGQWSAWAAEPLAGEKICFATEGTNMLDSGWMEGAAKSAHRCLASNVFKDVISSQTLSALERCRANISSGANRYLDSGNKNSGNDVCLLLRNEYHIRDLANYSYCGGPSTYEYPTLASFTSTAYQPNQVAWAGATSTTVYDTTTSGRCRGGRC